MSVEHSENETSDIPSLMVVGEKRRKQLLGETTEKEDTDIQISRATLEDAQLFDRYFPYGPANFHEYKYQQMQEGIGVLLLAKEGEKPVGQIVLELGGPNAPDMESEVTEALWGIPEITAAEIADAYQGRGLGTSMIEALEHEARQLGFTQLCIGVSENNKDARRLYERLGYKSQGAPKHVVHPKSEEPSFEVEYLVKELA